jgi:hypothetical protein
MLDVPDIEVERLEHKPLPFTTVGARGGAIPVPAVAPRLAADPGHHPLPMGR